MRTKARKTGSCYKSAFDFVERHKEWTLVHGIAVLTGGKFVGQKFGHAWCEKDGIVMDTEKGIVVPKVLYYAVGNISYTRKYTWKQAKKKALETLHYGCWDKKIDKTLHG